MKTYKQYDARWGKKKYNARPYNMASSGCGPCACAMCVQTQKKYRKVTPKNTYKFMMRHGYATYGNGTAWAGIKACLEHYDFNVKGGDISMSEFMREVAKPGVRGVLLFRAGTRGGVTWTTSGHYIAVNDVKKKGNRHYIYTHDSGGRNHTGWYCYETTMRGLVVQAWIAKPKRHKKK